MLETRKRLTVSDSETELQVPGLFELLRWIDPVHNPKCGQQEPPSVYKKPGLIAFADGVNWNPGYGPGHYWWTGSVWKPLAPEEHVGSFYADNISLSITIGAPDTFYQIASGMSGGVQRGCVFQNAREVKITRAGLYTINYSVSAETASVANKEMETEIMINGTPQGAGSSHALLSPGGSSRPETTSGHTPFNLAVNDLVSLGVANHTDTTSIVVQHVSLMLEEKV